MDGAAFPQDIHLDEISSFIDYWKSIRGDRKVPKKSALKVPELSPVLDRLLLMENHSPSHTTVRLISAGHSILLDKDFTGENLHNYYPEEAMIEAYTAANLHRCGISKVAEYRYMADPAFSTHLHCTVLPMRDDNDLIRFWLVLLTPLCDQATLQRISLLQDRPTVEQRLVSDLEFLEVGNGKPDTVVTTGIAVSAFKGNQPAYPAKS